MFPMLQLSVLHAQCTPFSWMPLTTALKLWQPSVMGIPS